MTEDRNQPSARQGACAAAERLHKVRGFVFDMDGTLVLGDNRNHGLKPLPGALDLTRWLDRSSIPYVVFTNGTAKTPGQYAGMLRDAGFDVPDQRMLTPVSCAADLFVSRGYKKVMVLGNEGMTSPLQDVGMEIVRAEGKAHADAVFVGYHRDLSMDGLESACHAVWGGARMFSASQTRFFATADGRALAPSRAISAMIKDMTGCRLTVTGKPSLSALRCAGHRLGLRPCDLAVVGDDPELEVPMAHRGGSLAIAVKTGLGAKGSFDHLAEAKRPHLDLSGVDELLRLFQG